MREQTPRTLPLLLALALLVGAGLPSGAGPAAAQAPEAAGAVDPAVEGTGGAMAAEGAEGAEEGGVAEAGVAQEVGGVPEADEAAEEAAAAAPREDLAADFYLSRCAGCHTIGEGYLSGPDLAPSIRWPADDLFKAVERMEKNVGPMTHEQVSAQVELLQDEAVKQRLSAARERQVAQMAATLEPGSPWLGLALFHGERPLHNGGVTCAACHRAPKQGRVRGGNLAGDLTRSYSRLGEQAVIAAAENPGFPLMRAAYSGHPVTRQEAVHLAAYLEAAEAQAGDGRDSPDATAAGAGMGAAVGWGGSGAAALFLAAMVLLYRGRNRGVRARLVRRAHRR